MKRMITAKNAANASSIGGFHLQSARPYCRKTANHGHAATAEIANTWMPTATRTKRASISFRSASLLNRGNKNPHASQIFHVEFHQVSLHRNAEWASVPWTCRGNQLRFRRGGADC